MADFPHTPNSSHDHCSSQRQSDSLSAFSLTESRYSLTVLSPATQAATQSVHEIKHPLDQTAMSVNTPSYAPLPRNTTLPLYPRHNFIVQPRQYQLQGPNQQDIPRKPSPLRISTSGPQKNAHGPFKDHYYAAVSTSNPGELVSRKRTATVGIDEANKHHHLKDLNLCPSSSPQSTAFPEKPDDPTELICLCTRAPKVPRPRNAFILYRQHHQASVAAQHPGLANPEISKLIGEQWHEQSEEIKNSWKRLAEEEKLRHQRQYPDYRYQPRRGGKNGVNGKLTPRVTAGDDPGRCQKCGGRFIATPRTPNTPSGMATTPAFAKPMVAGLPPQGPQISTGPSYMMLGSMMHNPNPKTVATDHLTKRGSGSSMVSVDSYGRRYTQPYHEDIEEDYAMISPTAPPQKRQRYHNGPNATYLSASPPMGHVTHHMDPRLAHKRPSKSGHMMLNPGLLPRLPPYHQSEQKQQQNRYSPAHIPPPPRTSPYFDRAQVSRMPPRSDGPGFDESLRLPPLQAQMPKSSSMNSESATLKTTNVDEGVGLGIMNSTAPPPLRQHLLPLTQQRPQWLYRLDMLRAISPPLKLPAVGISPFETRGPVIALEGAFPHILEELTTIIEKALSVAGEYAVKIWPDHRLSFLQNGEHEGNSSATAMTKREDADNFTSAVAKFQYSMLHWHRTSEELVKYITHHPSHSNVPANTKDLDETYTSPSPKQISANSNHNITNTISSAGSPSQHKLPVAVLSRGYSLTVTDRCAAALVLADAYQPDDHWRWVATMWRGIVGPDLTVYVKQCEEGELRFSQVVEFAASSVLVVRVPEGEEDWVVDEKLERRLGFEIMEWVRGNQFGDTPG